MIDAQLFGFIHLDHLVFSRKALRRVFALTIAIMGIVNGLTVLLPTRPGRLAFLVTLFDNLAPFAPSLWPFLHAGQTVALILGFFLLLLALGLARGKRRAWQFAIVLLPLTALAHIVKGFDVEEATLAMVLWSGLTACKSCFRVESDPWRARQGLVFLLLGWMLL